MAFVLRLRLCLYYTAGCLFVPTWKAMRNRHEKQQHTAGTCKSFTHFEHYSGAVSRESSLHEIPFWIFTAVPVTSYSFISLFSPRSYRYCYESTVAKNVTHMWRSTPTMKAAQPRSFTDITPQSSFSGVNRRLFRYGFRGGANALPCPICDSLL